MKRYLTDPTRQDLGEKMVFIAARSCLKGIWRSGPRQMVTDLNSQHRSAIYFDRFLGSPDRKFSKHVDAQFLIRSVRRVTSREFRSVEFDITL